MMIFFTYHLEILSLRLARMLHMSRSKNIASDHWQVFLLLSHQLLLVDFHLLRLKKIRLKYDKNCTKNLEPFDIIIRKVNSDVRTME